MSLITQNIRELLTGTGVVFCDDPTQLPDKVQRRIMELMSYNFSNEYIWQVIEEEFGIRKTEEGFIYEDDTLGDLYDGEKNSHGLVMLSDNVWVILDEDGDEILMEPNIFNGKTNSLKIKDNVGTE